MGEPKSDDALIQFDAIEQRVDKLFEKIESLETDNAKLKDKITELEQDVQEKSEAVKRYEQERELMRSKVDALLEKINRSALMDNEQQADGDSG